VLVRRSHATAHATVSTGEGSASQQRRATRGRRATRRYASSARDFPSQQDAPIDPVPEAATTQFGDSGASDVREEDPELPSIVAQLRKWDGPSTIMADLFPENWRPSFGQWVKPTEPAIIGRDGKLGGGAPLAQLSELINSERAMWEWIRSQLDLDSLIVESAPEGIPALASCLEFHWFRGPRHHPKNVPRSLDKYSVVVIDSPVFIYIEAQYRDQFVSAMNMVKPEFKTVDVRKEVAASSRYRIHVADLIAVCRIAGIRSVLIETFGMKMKLSEGTSILQQICRFPIVGRDIPEGAEGSSSVAPTEEGDAATASKPTRLVCVHVGHCYKPLVPDHATLSAIWVVDNDGQPAVKPEEANERWYATRRGTLKVDKERMGYSEETRRMVGTSSVRFENYSIFAPLNHLLYGGFKLDLPPTSEVRVVNVVLTSKFNCHVVILCFYFRTRQTTIG
jgi:hypothetical protein